MNSETTLEAMLGMQLEMRMLWKTYSKDITML